MVSPVRERRGGWRRRETEGPEEDLSTYGECLICFGIGRGVLWWVLVFCQRQWPGRCRTRQARGKVQTPMSSFFRLPWFNIRDVVAV